MLFHQRPGHQTGTVVHLGHGCQLSEEYIWRVHSFAVHFE